MDRWNFAPALIRLGLAMAGPWFFRLIAGVLLASGVALYLHYRHDCTPQIGLMERLFLGVSLAPILEASFFG